MARSLTAQMEKLAASGILQRTAKKDAPEQQREISIALIAPDPEQPRRDFDQEKLQSLAQNIAIHGVLQPITVQPINEAGLHLIIMGERRYRAAQLSGLTHVPAIVREVTTHLRAIQLTENVQRADLTPLEIGRAVTAMIDAGATRVEIAKSLGWNKTTITEFSKVPNMPTELQDLAARGVPIRALNSLFRCWKEDEAKARRWVSEQPVESINRITIEQLWLSIRPTPTGAKQDTDGEPRQPLEPNGAAQDAEGEPTQHTGAAKDTADEQTQPKSKVAILCRYRGEIGRLLTDRAPSNNKAICISLKNGAQIVEALLSEIEIFEVILLEGT